MISTLSVQQAKELLARNKMGRLGCISDGEPYVVPVNYVFDNEQILIHSLYGKKISAMRENSKVCFQVDEIEGDFKWRSIIVYGHYEELTNPQEKANAMNQLLKQFPSLTPVETYIVEGTGTPAPIMFRIRINKITSLSHS
jgi:uncharacterized protein